VHAVGVVGGRWVGLCDKDIFGGSDILERSRFWEGIYMSPLCSAVV